MTQIDFYILPEHPAYGLLHYSSRLIEKVYRLGYHIYAHCHDGEQCAQLDEQLWQTQPASFIPHSLAQDSHASPITIGCQEHLPSTHGSVLINLAGTVPTFFNHFDRVAEIVPGNPDDRHRSRDNYRFYQAQGYQLKTNKISA